MSKTICVIPARGGSRRIPLKNIKEFHGEPIISYSIKTAQESGLFDEIIVSTDSHEIASVAGGGGVTVHKRSDEMAENEVGTQAVMKCVLDDLDIKDGVACCIYATAPLMSAGDLERGHSVLFSMPLLDYAFSVGDNPLCDAAQFYWGRVNSFITGHPLVDAYTAMIPIAHERVCDINTHDDWARAEKMYEALHP